MSSPKLQFAFFNLHFSIFNAFPCPPLPSNHWHSIGAPHPKPFARDSHLRTSPRHWRRFRHARTVRLECRSSVTTGALPRLVARPLKHAKAFPIELSGIKAVRKIKTEGRAYGPYRLVAQNQESQPSTLQRDIRRNRKALPITETELKLMAAAAIIGLNRIPKKG